MSSFLHSSKACPFGLVLLFTAIGVSAQEPAPPTLSLREALRRATELNPALAAQSYAARAADGFIEQAGLRPNPTLEASLENFAGTGRLRDVAGLETTVQATQTFERGSKRERRVALASRERDTAVKDFAVRQSEVLAETATAYVELLAAQQRLALAAEPLKLARETVAAVDVRVRAAAASPAESARARASLAAAQADHARAQASLEHARVTLAATWGGEPSEITSVAGVLHIPEALPSEQTFLTRLASHPRLDLQQTVISGRRAALQLEQAIAVQDITVGGGVRFLREGSDVALVGGVSFPIPFRNKNQGNIRAARENLAGAERSVRAVEVELRVAFTAAWRDLTAAHGAAQNLRREAMPATEEAYATVRHAYEQGQLPLIDVLDAQRALAAIRRELIDAETAFAAALARAEALTDASFAALTDLLNHS